MEKIKKDKLKKIITIILVVFIVILITTLTYLYISSDNFSIINVTVGDSSKDDAEDIEEIENTSKSIRLFGNNTLNLQEEVYPLSIKYKDVIGWLKVPSTSIDFAIFQSNDNVRYLRHTRDNKYDIWGETFLDYRSNINNMNDKSHFIIYGHNTEVDSCFTPLLNYKNKDFYDKNSVIQFSTLNGNYKWQVFSVYQTDVNDDYIRTEFNSEQSYVTFLSKISSKSMYNTGITVDGSDTILTLSTCDYYKDNGRFAVHCKLIK